MNYYQILGVGTEALADEIRLAYLEEIKKYHPDINPTEEAKQRTIQIIDAYKHLSDPKLKAIYDQLLYTSNIKNSFIPYIYYNNPKFEDMLSPEGFKEREEKRKQREAEEKKRNKAIQNKMIVGVMVLVLALSFGIWTFYRSHVVPAPITNVSNRGLTQAPKGIAGSSVINVLLIDNNELEQFPPEIASLPNLTQLNISHNKLTSLSPEFFQIKGLAIVNLSANKLKILAPDISKLKVLHELDLSDNQLTDLPVEALADLEYLKTLNLKNNPLPHNYAQDLKIALPKVEIIY